MTKNNTQTTQTTTYITLNTQPTTQKLAKLLQTLQTTQKSAYEAYNTMLSGLETISRINLNEEQRKAIGENLVIAWYNAGTNRMNATTAADHVANELLNITRKLDIEQEKLLKDWIYQGINAGMQIFEGITDVVKIKALIKSLAKGVAYRDWETDRKSTRLNSSHITRSRMPSSA